MESSLMNDCPEIDLPLKRKTAEVLWRAIKRPKVDRWLDGADWIYCPRELYVPVCDTRYAVTVHDTYRLEPDYQHHQPRHNLFRRWLLERAVLEADLVLSVSNFTKSRLIELFDVDPGKIRVVGNGVEDRYFSASDNDFSAISTAEMQPYLLSVGGVTWKKGGANILAAASELRHIAPQLTLVIVGLVETEFASRVAEASNIRMVRRGFPDSEMHQLVRNAAALLILSEYEGFGIPALEAMAAGVPVVAADRAALPEVVGQAGLLVDPDNSEEVAQTIIELIDDADACANLIAKGRARAEQYRWGSCVERLCLALEEFSNEPSRIATG